MNEPDDKPGVANFASGLLTQGTKTKDAGEIANLDRIGRAASSAAGRATSSRS